MKPIDFTYISEVNNRHPKQYITVSNGAEFIVLNISKTEKFKASNVLYLHLNQINKKCYVGITVMQAGERWSSGAAYKRNRRFGAAIQKHGWEAFDSFILAFADNRDSLNQAEILAIAAAGGHKTKFTYNLSPGGDLVAENDKPLVGVLLGTSKERRFKSGSDAARQLGMTNPDMPMSVARGDRTSAAGWWFRFKDDVTKKPPTSWGETFRIEQVRRKQGKNIIAVNYKTLEEREFRTAAQAAQELGIEQSQVSTIAAGKTELVSAKGWWFRFKDDEKEIPLAHGAKLTRLKRDRTVFATNLSTGELREFRNCTVADIELDIYKGAAASVASGDRTSAADWWFSFNKEQKPPTDFKFALVAKARSKPVVAINLENSEEITYPSAKNAGEILGIPRSSISNVITGKLKSVKGFMFRLK